MQKCEEKKSIAPKEEKKEEINVKEENEKNDIIKLEKEEEIESLGGVKNEVEPAHLVLEEKKGQEKKIKKILY